MSIAKRLKYAREVAGLTLQQVDERTGIGISSLSDYENDKRAPRVSQLQALADAYHRSVSFFLEKGPIPRETVLWRERPEGAAATEIQGRFLQLCQQYHNLEIWCRQRRSCMLPQPQATSGDFHYSHAAWLARQVRSALELGDRPGQSLLRVLEEVCGVKVFHLSFRPTGSAACTVSEAYGPAILLNSEAVRWRRNFDLAHELFHILAWPIFRSDPTGDEMVNAQEEKLATCFAANLLMPEETVKHAIREKWPHEQIAFSVLSDLYDLYDIARQFDVSVEALLWRMKFLYNRDEEQTQADIERYRQVADLLEMDRERDMPPERPLRFKSLAMKAYSRGEISKGVLAEYLGISRQEAMRLTEREIAGDEEVQLPHT